jgi:flagellar export protein FliJ
MLKFVFRLEAVLKIRKIAEEMCRQELGRLQVKRVKLEDAINFEVKAIEETYEDQQKHLNAGLRTSGLAYFSSMIEGKRSKIKILKTQRDELDQEIQHQRELLIQKKADLKVIENMKERDLLAYKKKYERDLNQKIEEQVMLWKENLKQSEEA